MESYKCPFCAEVISADATKCPFCGETIPTQNVVKTKLEAFINALNQYKAEGAPKIKSLFVLDEITPEVLERHKKYYVSLSADEKPLLVVNHKVVGSIGGYGWTGLIITDKNIYFKCVKDAFLSGIYAAGLKGVMPFDSIKTIAIGEHDHCYGTAYVGHQLVINKEVKGLLRMGGAIMFDDDLIEALGKIFKSLS